MKMTKVVKPDFASHGGVLPVIVVGFMRWADSAGWFRDSCVTDVITVAQANEYAYRMTLQFGFAHFWDRAKKKNWGMPEYKIVRIRIDPESGALIYYADSVFPEDRSTVLDVDNAIKTLEVQVSSRVREDKEKRLLRS